jgi:hypothetical protein
MQELGNPARLRMCLRHVISRRGGKDFEGAGTLSRELVHAAFRTNVSRLIIAPQREYLWLRFLKMRRKKLADCLPIASY